MRRRRSGSIAVDEWPPALRNVIRAAELECPRGHADALFELTSLALSKVPSRGIFDPAVRGEHDIFAVVESVARAHLQLGDARTALKAALEAAALSLDKRDNIEQAALEIQTVSDTAYFYAGLAFGLTSLSLYRS
jgi:hypothetical protein